jgi:hypothetical protein
MPASDAAFKRNIINYGLDLSDVDERSEFGGRGRGRIGFGPIFNTYHIF